MFSLGVDEIQGKSKVLPQSRRPQRVQIFSPTSAALRWDFHSMTIDKALGFTKVLSNIQSEHSLKFDILSRVKIYNA